MGKRTAVLVLVMIGSLFLGGCLVKESTYLKKVEEADGLTRDLAGLQKRYDDLAAENKGLKAAIDGLKGDLAGMTAERDKLATERKSLEGDLKSPKSESLQRLGELRQRIADLETENAALRKDLAARQQEIATLQKAKVEEVQMTSKTYEDLLEKMKHEISQGQVTISELKGKLTVNMVDAILFDSGKAEVKPEGLAILQKVIDILKSVKTDKAIRIEGHTDDVQIVGNLAKRFPTNWELSAARAINVTRYLQQQGIDPTFLGAIAFGEFRPVASNETPEGKAKNRRIEINLVNRD